MSVRYVSSTPITSSTSTSGYFTTSYTSSAITSFTRSIVPISSGYIDANNLNDLLQNFISDHNLNVKDKIFTPKEGYTINTLDGTVIDIDDTGNIKVTDNDAKIIYKSNRIREFNRFLNASDLLETFIRFIGKEGVKQSEVLSIPIELFINWLIIEASKEDGEEPPLLPVTKEKVFNRCLSCGRFIKQSTANIAKFCNPQHYALYMETHMNE